MYEVILVSISSSAVLSILENVISSLIVSIVILPQIIPEYKLRSLYISGVTESTKCPNTILFLPINNLLFVNVTTAVSKKSKGFEFFWATNVYKGTSSGFIYFSIISACFLILQVNVKKYLSLT